MLAKKNKKTLSRSFGELHLLRKRSFRSGTNYNIVSNGLLFSRSVRELVSGVTGSRRSYRHVVE